MKKYLLIISLVLSIFAFAGVAFAHERNSEQCNEHNPWNCPLPTQICDKGEHWNNPHCISPTPIIVLSPSCIPTQIQEDTPTASPSAEVTGEISPEVTQSPTVAPTITTTVTVTSTETSNSNSNTETREQVPEFAPHTGRGE